MAQHERRFLLRHPLALAGIGLASGSAVVFIALTVAMFVGMLVNPYAGLVVFVGLPAVFLVGLLLIPWGMTLQRRAVARGEKGAEWPVVDFRQPRTRRVGVIIAGLTAVNIVIFLVAGYGTLHWMESPQFCGQVCHEPMHPQYTAWQNAPHSNITCVECHIGEGGEAFVHYKTAGVRQLFNVVTNNYPRPIPGVADMRPALETCGNCHWPGRSIGDAVRVLRTYADDEENSESATVLVLQMGGPDTPSGRGIHWHANPNLRIEFVATDPDLQTIPWVQVTQPDGSVQQYVAEGVSADQVPEGTRRRMDCLDCHNVVAHRIARSAEEAVDRAIAAGALPRRLPFVRREGVKLLQASYETTDAAQAAIDEGLRGFYKTQSGEIDPAALERAVAALQRIYQRNVFPTMDVTFGVYPDNIGHMASQGCFRCHDGGHTASDGSTITADCESCHRMLDTPVIPVS